MQIPAKEIPRATRHEWIRFVQSTIINESTGCWEWNGLRFTNGYGRFCIHRTSFVAHRYSYTQLRGAVDPLLTIDHLCRNKVCVNPEHLEPVPIGVNTARGTTWEFQRNKTHCPQGHPYDEKNTYRTMQKGGHVHMRRCRICNAAGAMRSYWKRKDL